MSEKKAKQKKRIGMIAGISIAVVGVIVVISLIASGAAMLAPKERVVKSNISANEILAINDVYGNVNAMGVPSEGAGWIFWQLQIEDDEFAKVLGIDSVICSNGTRRIIEFDNGFLSTKPDGSIAEVGTTFAFYYLGNWYIHEYGIPEVFPGMPTPAETLESIWEMAS